MKRVKVQPIGDIVRDMMRQEGLETPLLEYRLIHNGWPEVVGSVIASRTENIRIFNNVLYVQISSAAVRQEVVLQRAEFVRKLNEFVDAYIISDIRVN